MTTRSDSSLRSVAPQPFSRTLVVHDVPDDGLDVAIEADASECAEVARDIGLPAIGTLTADFHIARRPGSRLNVVGTVKARITQTCVVSLDPFESEVEQPVEIDFAPSKDAPEDRGDARQRSSVSRRRRAEVAEPPAPPPVAVVGEDDPPDPIVDGRIDLGAVAVEFLALGLDLYPKKPGVHFVETVIGDTESPKTSAFAALGRLKDRS